jgi:hypothetical protein
MAPFKSCLLANTNKLAPANRYGNTGSDEEIEHIGLATTYIFHEEAMQFFPAIPHT